MVRINLLPVRAAARREELRAQLSIAVLSLLLMSIVLGFLHYSVGRRINHVNEEIRTGQQEINRLKSVIAEVNKFKKKSKVLETKLSVIRKLNAGRMDHVYFMDELSNMIPEKLWLSKLSEESWMLKMDGTAFSGDIIANFMTNMETSRMFNNIQLKVVKKAKKSGLDLQNFSIEARFTPPRAKED